MTSLKPHRLTEGFIGALVAFLLTVPPVLLMRGLPGQLFSHWQEVVFYIICIAGGGIAGYSGFGLHSGIKELTGQRNMVWASLIFAFLYIACSALCARLHIGAFECQWWRGSGIALVALGAALRLWSIVCLGRFHSAFVALQPGHRVIQTGPYRYIAHPSYLGALIVIVGTPMVFGSWLPLLALPGCFVAINWRIKDEEAFLTKYLGGEYQAYRKQRSRFIPGWY